MYWLILSFNANFGFTAIYDFTVYVFTAIHGLKATYCNLRLHLGMCTGLNLYGLGAAWPEGKLK